MSLDTGKIGKYFEGKNFINCKKLNDDRKNVLFRFGFMAITNETLELYI